MKNCMISTQLVNLFDRADSRTLQFLLSNLKGISSAFTLGKEEKKGKSGTGKNFLK